MEAVYVDVNGDSAEEMKRLWDSMEFGIPLTIVESPYREVIQPLVEHVKASLAREDVDIVTVVLPEFVPDSPIDYMLHDQTPLLIKTAMFNLPRVVVTDVPYRLGHTAEEGLNERGAADRRKPKIADAAMSRPPLDK
jgi:hypothetical protein